MPAPTPVRIHCGRATLVPRLLGWILGLFAGATLLWLGAALLTGASALAATPTSTAARDKTNPTLANAQPTTTGPASTDLEAAASAAPPPAAPPAAAPASPAPSSDADWDRVAQCESGGNWKISTGNGHHGGLQFTPSTWKAYGGLAYAPTANKATKAQQIEIAERVRAKQGWGAWPHCSGKGHGKSTKTDAGGKAGKKTTVTPPTKAQHHGKPQAKAQHRTTGNHRVNTTPTVPTRPGGPVTVQPGDSLSKIAKDNATKGGWQELYAKNKDKITNPSLIRPGQELTLTGTK